MPSPARIAAPADACRRLGCGFDAFVRARRSWDYGRVLLAFAGPVPGECAARDAWAMMHRQRSSPASISCLARTLETGGTPLPRALSGYLASCPLYRHRVLARGSSRVRHKADCGQSGHLGVGSGFRKGQFERTVGCNKRLRSRRRGSVRRT